MAESSTAGAPATPLRDRLLALPGVAGAVADSARYLASDAALEALRLDPYWPKWDSPWWHVTLLHELGLVDEVPRRIVEPMTAALSSHYLRTFPLRPEEMPTGAQGRHICCFCALGNMVRALHDRGVEVPLRVPWAIPFFLRYQMADGGLNCDEAAYLRPTPRSSFQSIAPAAEAVLAIRARGGLPPEEARFLERAAGYLLERRLARSLSKGAPCDETWYVPVFPRFYSYDALRGLSLVARWAAASGARLPREAIAEPLSRLEAFFAGDAPPRAGPPAAASAPPEMGALAARPAAIPPLLERARRPDVARAVLESEWVLARALLARVPPLD